MAYRGFQDGGGPGTSETAIGWSAIEGGGLAQLILTTITPFQFHFFLNGHPIPQEEVESIYVMIGEPDNPTEQPESVALLSRYAHDMASGERTKQAQSLFPGTLDVVLGGLRRRMTITCPDAENPLDVYVRLGLRSDGSTTQIEGGLKRVQVFLAEGILQVKLAWEDGSSEDLVTTTRLN